MNPALQRRALPLLRWTLAMVVFVQSLEFAFSPSAGHFFLKMGLPFWVRPALGLAEAMAATLFVVPFTMALGGYLLWVTFALAALIHLLHGQREIGGLVVYAAAVLACIPAPNHPQSEPRP